MLFALFSLAEFFTRCWSTLCELAPWLLLGMLISGILHVALPKNFVRRRFRGYGGVAKSVLLGVPLPLCSCGVIPAGIGLKNDGASDGAAVGFLISTPQTGVDSVLVSASFFGWPFAIFKMLAAVVTGLIGGWLTEATAGDTFEEPNIESQRPATDSSQWFSAFWSHAMEVLESIWLWLLIGVAVSALIGALGFESFFKSMEQGNLLFSMLLMLAIAIPLYVCATASVPIAAALVASGLPAAVAIVFLMAGPATNLTTMGAIRKRFGWRVLGIYLGTLVVGSFLGAFLFDWVLGGSVNSSGIHGHHHQNWWSMLSSVVVLLLIGQIIAKRFITTEHQTSDSTIEISVEGMHCGNCANRVETAVSKLDGVDSIRVDLGKGIASINGDAPVDLLESVIEGLGFKAKRAKATS